MNSSAIPFASLRLQIRHWFRHFTGDLSLCGASVAMRALTTPEPMHTGAMRPITTHDQHAHDMCVRTLNLHTITTHDHGLGARMHNTRDQHDQRTHDTQGQHDQRTHDTRGQHDQRTHDTQDQHDQRTHNTRGQHDQRTHNTRGQHDQRTHNTRGQHDQRTITTHDHGLCIHTLDTRFQGATHAIAVYAVVGSDGLVLVDTGAATTIAQCAEQVQSLGYALTDVKHVLITHVHLDHAGAAWWWAETQGAQIYAHPRAARHLIDPSQLLASAGQVYGERMGELWGDVRPIRPERITVLNDCDTVQLAGLTITAWDTPGHAKHHNAYLIGRVAFTGDVAGVRLPNSSFISLASAPPQFDPVAYDKSLTRLANASLSAIYPTHFGRIDDVADHIGRYQRIIQESAEWVRDQLQQGVDSATLQKRYAEYERSRATISGMSDALWWQYQCANPANISADGIALYWQKRTF